MAQPRELPSSQGADVSPASVITVDEFGHAETEDSRAPQTIIHREQLSPQTPELRIDLDKVGGSYSEQAVYVVLQDFGLPFRIMTIHKLFVTDSIEREEITSITSTKADKVQIGILYRNWYAASRTATYLSNHDRDEGDIKLGPGEHVIFGHDGESADFRTGFIINDAEILAFDGSWESPEKIKEWVQDFTPFIKISYEAGFLIITAYDEINADVIFEKVVSQADTVAAGEASPSRTREQILEVALARSKELLISVQKKLQEALFENDQLKRREAAGTRQESGFRVESETKTDNDPYGHCQVLGLIPERLFSKPPDEAERIVAGVRRLLSTLYHPDINSQIDQSVLGEINDSADKILVRIRTGSWGRS